MSKPTDPNLAEILEFFGLTNDLVDSPSEELSAIPKDEWAPGIIVSPPAAIQRYLAAEDRLTRHAVDMMELAIEKANGVEPPWFITSVCDGDPEEGTLMVKRFILLNEPSDEEDQETDRIIAGLMTPRSR